MQFIFDDLLQTFLASFVLWYIYELRPSFSSAKLALVRQFSTNRRASWTDFFWSSSVIQDSFGSTQAVHRVDSVVWSPCSNESFAPADWEVLSENRLGSTENRLAWWFTGACIGSAEPHSGHNCDPVCRWPLALLARRGCLSLLAIYR